MNGSPAWTPGSFLAAITAGERAGLLALGTTRRPPGGRRMLVEGRRLRWANERRSEFSALPAHVRLAHLLAEIAVGCGEPVDDGLLIPVQLTQTELAALIGAAEDTVQRALRTLRSQGLVRTGYRQITVLDDKSRRALADDKEP